MVSPITAHEQTPEEKALTAVYEQEQTAMAAPTAIRNSARPTIRTVPMRKKKLLEIARPPNR
jgi:hypothetical protein